MNPENGPPGSPIVGSALCRAYCVECGEPMRVMKFHPGEEYYCLSCAPPPLPPHSPPTNIRDDTSPAWENAVRAIEDQ
jgi:hypothetical protein